jgi:hypothetical protein
MPSEGNDGGNNVRVIIATLVSLSLAVPCAAQTQQPRSTSASVGWTLAGVGIGFGVGTWIGFSKFDQATYAERKNTTTAVSCASAGGVIAFLLTRHRGRHQTAATRRPTTPSAPNRR